MKTLILALFIATGGCSKNSTEKPPPGDEPIVTITIDTATRYQTIEGFGGFGAKDVYWSNGPFTSPEFVNTLINDLGLTILRDNLPPDFEDINDDGDPGTTDLSKFHYNSLSNHFQYLKDMKAAGLKKLIVSIWSAPAWMKTNNNVNGIKADAPEYTTTPTSQNNQLRADMYEEFAERCVAYLKIIKQETAIDVYALSLQNEPRFTEPYESCVFNGEALRDLIKITGRRLRKEGIQTRIFLPEDIGYLDGISSMVQPTLSDDSARLYAGIVAVHGYAFDGVTANSPDAQTWQTMYSWGSQYNMPLWMTETSGFDNTMKGGLDLAKAMYTAMTFGNVSAWLHWQLSQEKIDGFVLMSSSGQKSKRYFASKNFYRYVRPGDARIKVAASEGTNIYPIAFHNDTANTTTIVVINDDAKEKKIKFAGTVPDQFEVFVTSAEQNCEDHGPINTSEAFTMPAGAVVTFYKKN